MMTTIAAPTTAADIDEMEAPLLPGGEPYPYVVVYGDGSSTYSDSLTEIIGVGIPEYALLGDSDADDDRRLEMRYDDLRSFADILQRWLTGDGIERGLVDVLSIGDTSLTALMSERINPFEGVSVDEDSEVLSFEWTCPIPLVLFVTDYAPYANRTAPTGNIIWIDPSTELTFMQALNALGVVDFMVPSQGAEV
jgi:hypothetical protein